MLSRQPLSRRIVLAFVLITILVSGTFSLGIVSIVHVIEEDLVSRGLDRDLNNVLHEELEKGLPPWLDADTRFFSTDRPGYAIPAQFANVPDGFDEILDGEESYYVYTRSLNGERYMLVQTQHEFEEREQMLFSVVFGGFILAVASAWLLGWLTARRIMAPVVKLSEQVSHIDYLNTAVPPLANDYVDDEIGRLAAAFDSTLGELRRSLERERLFTSDVSHELRTPLTIVATSCELLEAAQLPAQGNEQVERIGRATAEMRDLVETFLILARPKPDQDPLEAGASLSGLCHEQSRRWETLIRNKGLDYEFLENTPDDQLYNATFLRTVISNLLRNAMHYTDKGFIRLTLEKSTLRVEDSGSGIPFDQQKSIFEPFSRGQRTRGEGLGLGLSLVKRICTHQGWNIRVDSLPAGGTCFTIDFQPAS